VTDLTRMTATELVDVMASGEASSAEIVSAHLDRIRQVEPTIHAFLHVADKAIEHASDIDRRRISGETLPATAGLPIAVKDVLCTTDMPTTAGSKILEGYYSPYDATVVASCRAAGMISLGKTNMDEFAMGSSTEHSGFGPSGPCGEDRHRCGTAARRYFRPRPPRLDVDSDPLGLDARCCSSGG
jgi:aspartyl-tRNA(Asn)/glutamyl-tRNA(Gln) amidotransferase subunit A